MVERLYSQVHVEIRPVQVVRAWKSNVADLSNGCFLKPGKHVERDEQLASIDKQPETVWRDVCDLNRGSALPKRDGFHLDAPR